MAELVTIVGAGPAGLAVAATLSQRNIGAHLIEASPNVGAAWRTHYDRLHLHTHKGGSGLPGLGFAADDPRFPSRDEVIAYLERYAAHFKLAPSFNETVTRIEPGNAGQWHVTTSKRELDTQQVVVASGNARVANVPSWPGLSDFAGETLHSSRYTNGARFRDKQVLVVGFGNSGGEIAIDLHEHGARPTISVRSAVNVIPRELLGLPIIAVSAMMSPLPARLADLLSKPLLALTIGDIEKLGFRKQRYGPLEQIERDGRIPLIDVGTLKLVRQGKIAIKPGIEHLTKTSVVFDNGDEGSFDAVIFATGYRPQLADFISSPSAFTGENGFATASGSQVQPGLWLCGFHVSAFGMLKDIADEAKRIALGIAATSLAVIRE